jgi:hypothetical protein
MDAGIPDLARRVMDRVGDRVMDGPCAGLRFPADRLPEIDAPVAKLVGDYERQLHGPVTSALDSGRSPFVDVGCAEGYYAIGLALRHRHLLIHAYDLAPSARSLCRDLATFNGCIDRVEIGRRCGVRQLRRVSLANAFVLVDIEGAEFAFFSAQMVALMREAMVIIELHRPPDDPAVVALRERFRRSHRVDDVSSEPSDAAFGPALSFLAPDERMAAMSEWRAGMEQTWLVLTPR